MLLNWVIGERAASAVSSPPEPTKLRRSAVPDTVKFRWTHSSLAIVLSRQSQYTISLSSCHQSLTFAAPFTNWFSYLVVASEGLTIVQSNYIHVLIKAFCKIIRLAILRH